MALARRFVERGEERLDVVAERGGPGTAANPRARLRQETGLRARLRQETGLRARLRQKTGLSPSAYRRRFGTGTGERLKV